MSIEQQAAEVIRHWMPRSPETWDDIANAAASNLAEKNLLAPEPHIIRTIKELEALDPETVVQRPALASGEWDHPMHAATLLSLVRMWPNLGFLPVTVIASGDQVRAARKALEEA